MPGIGVGFLPSALNRALIDDVMAVTYEHAFAAARKLARVEGILAGLSSGAAKHPALDIAARPESQGKMIVVLLADTAERYVPTALFERDRSAAAVRRAGEL
jgi:cysteine synthase A